MSSERSTLVRRWPSEPDLLACCKDLVLRLHEDNTCIIVVEKKMGFGRGGLSYYVSRGEFLLCTDDSTSTLGSVESSFSSNDGLTLSASAADLAPNLGNRVPVV